MNLTSKFISLLFFFEALFFLYYFKLLLSIRKVQKVLYSSQNEAIYKDINPGKLRRIRTAIIRADRFALWKNRCIVKSLSARAMINRRGGHADLYLGVNKEDGKGLKAHAWLISQNIEIVHKGNKHYPATTKI
jgi:hypothetical protein